jgi:hypothetical protein
MKNIKLFVLIVLLVGCKEQSQKVDGFIINGKINQLNNSELLMLKFIDGGIEMDSISVVNHKFEYSGQVFMFDQKNVKCHSCTSNVQLFISQSIS